MGGLWDSLNIARSTLGAAQAGVAITGQNIANANTVGFHRRRLVLSPVDPPPILGGGVRVDGAFRCVDELLARRIIGGQAEDSYATTRQALLMQIEDAAGKFGDSGLGAALSSLSAKFSALTTKPNDPTARAELLAAAQSICDAFHQATSGLKSVADGADRDIVSTITQVNNKSAAVAELNAQIIQAEANGLEASDLRDQRDVLVNELAGLTGGSSFVDSSGSVCFTVNGATLIQGNHAATMRTTPDAALNNYNRIEIVDGGNTINVTTKFSSGKLGGLINTRDNVISGLQQDLDQLAYDFSSQINQQHRAGFGLDGVGGRDLFNTLVPPSVTSGAAAQISLRAGMTADQIAASSTAAGVPGDASNATAIVNLFGQNLAGGGTTTFVGQTASLVGKVGLMSQQAQTASSLAKDQLIHLQSLQQSSDGVSLDEEMVQLVQYQRCYQAGTKILQTIDSLMEKVINL